MEAKKRGYECILSRIQRGRGKNTYSVIDTGGSDEKLLSQEASGEVTAVFLLSSGRERKSRKSSLLL